MSNRPKFSFIELSCFFRGKELFFQYYYVLFSYAERIPMHYLSLIPQLDWSRLFESTPLFICVEDNFHPRSHIVHEYWPAQKTKVQNRKRLPAFFNGYIFIYLSLVYFLLMLLFILTILFLVKENLIYQMKKKVFFLNL